VHNNSLANTSVLSRDLASGLINPSSHTCEYLSAEMNKSLKRSHQVFLFYLVRTYAILVSRWGGNAIDVVNPKTTLSTSIAVEKSDSSITSLLNVLCFSTSFIKFSWAMIQTNETLVNELQEIVDVNKRYVFERSFNF